MPFRNDELVLVYAARIIRSRRTKPVAFADVADQPFVGLHAGSSLHRLLTRAAADASTALNWRIHVTSFDAACAMVAAGLGVSDRAESCDHAVHSFAVASSPYR